MSHDCHIVLLERENLARAVEAGPHDPLLGGLIDLGTVALLDPGLGAAQLEALVAGRVEIETMAVLDEAQAEQGRARLERVARQGRLLLLAWDASLAHRALLVLTGRDLPNLGFVGACGPQRLAATLAFLLEGAPAAADTIFAEPESTVRPEERDLMQRLTKLYGD